MPTQTNSDPKPELFFGLVGPAGVNLADLSGELKSELLTLGYQSVEIRMSDLLPNFTGWAPIPADNEFTEFARIRHLQEMGNAFRHELEDGAALARSCITAIREEREKISGDARTPASAVAYIIHQLKHPLEVALFRKVYGDSFALIAGHSSRENRESDLAKRMAKIQAQPGEENRFKGKASDVIQIDQNQADDLGQNTRDTYPKADFFANMGIPMGQHEVRRFVQLLFGHPFHTPSPEEFAMYQASAVGLRSSDDNRQVGAAIVDLTRDQNGDIKNSDVIAAGMNEVPRGGGGFYWGKESPDLRDQALLAYHHEDRAKEIKISALAELLERVSGKRWFKDEVENKRPTELARELLPDLKRTQFMDIGEFSRPVHAEMAAIIDAARRGVAVRGHTMYVTTFPCHNCAKHIIAAGLRRVVYLEPYPKSRANNLHGEEISLDPQNGQDIEGKVTFTAFSGIAPRQYRQLFSMSERGAKNGLPLTEWNAKKLTLLPRYVGQNAALAYMAAETQALNALPGEKYVWDRDHLGPAS